MSKSGLALLQETLAKNRNLEECLLYDLRLAHFGYGVDLVFNNVWGSDGKVRKDALERPVLVAFRLLGVVAMQLTGGLTAGMVEHPEMINWGLSEIARVEASSTRPGMRVSVLWEGSRRIDVDFHRFESIDK